MRLLLDESLPWRLARLLDAHQVESVQRAGWAGIKNGALLKLAAAAHDAFITADQNLQYQQNLRKRRWLPAWAQPKALFPALNRQASMPRRLRR